MRREEEEEVNNRELLLSYRFGCCDFSTLFFHPHDLGSQLRKLNGRILIRNSFRCGHLGIS